VSNRLETVTSRQAGAAEGLSSNFPPLKSIYILSQSALVTLDPLKPLAYRTLDLKIFANMFCHTTQRPHPRMRDSRTKTTPMYCFFTKTTPNGAPLCDTPP
jgi:hypothetical protein